MATRDNSLQAVLDQTVKTVAPEPMAQSTSPGGKFYRPSRAGRRLIAGHFEPKVAKELKMLAVEEETTVQALLEEALQLLFVKKGKEAIIRS